MIKKLLTIGMLITMFANDSYICAAYKRTAPVAINPLKTRRKIKKIKKRNKHIKVETRAPTFGEIVMTASFCLLGVCGGACFYYSDEDSLQEGERYHAVEVLSVGAVGGAACGVCALVVCNCIKGKNN